LKSPITRQKLSSGITLYLDEAPFFRSASVVVAVVGGSRAETPEENGLTHLIEHLLFKRTSKKGQTEIAFAIDEFGGDINAFTDSESFCLYGSVVKERGPELLDFLLELLFDSQFTEEDLVLEKSIIRQEIIESDDDTSDLVSQEFRKLFWKDDSLSRPILGTIETLESFTAQGARDFLTKCLVGERLIIAISGFSIDPSSLPKLEQGKRPTFASTAASPALSKVKRAGQQTHFTLGWRWPAILEPDYLSGLVLSTILGHGTSSRLFQLLREREGLCYDLGVHVDSYPDTAACIFSSSFEAANFKKVCNFLREELLRVQDAGIPEDEFERNRRMIRAQLEMEEDSPRGRLWRAVESEISVSKYVSTDEVLRKLALIERSAVERIAESHLTNSFYAVVGGDIPKKFEEQLKW